MQAVYDVLEAKGRRMTMLEIAGACWLHRVSVRHALTLLMHAGVVESGGTHNARQYELAAGAVRPVDMRGRTTKRGAADAC